MKLKAWELLKRIDELGEQCLGERYKRVEYANILTVVLNKDDIVLAENGPYMYHVPLYGNKVFELIEEKFYLQDEFIARTNEPESYLNYDMEDDIFAIDSKTNFTPDIFKNKFTQQDMIQYNIPQDKYKKIPVEEE